MAEVVAGIGVSHIPALAVAMEQGGAGFSPEVFAKFAPVREWVSQLDLDTVIVAYNDHASAFSLELLPTFVVGAAGSYPPADEGYGARDVPAAEGDRDLSWHIVDSVIPEGFDLAIAQKLEVDHGLTVPLSVIFGSPAQWPVRVIPVEVNVVQQPTPSARRCFELGRAIARAVDSFAGVRRVGVIGTGGMSHQLQGLRAGHINSEFDRMFLTDLVNDPERLLKLTNLDYIREAGSEGAEIVMWLIMRGALGGKVRAVQSAYHVPVSNTAAGLIAIEPARGENQ